MGTSRVANANLAVDNLLTALAERIDDCDLD